jgi:ABC-type amino acid transport substrate-binding protein
MKKLLRASAIVSLLVLAATVVTPPEAEADNKKTMCVFDPSGKNGDAYKQAVKYETAAAAWGVDFELKAYTDEKVAAGDFQNGQCDAALITGVRTQKFSKAAYSVEALGLFTSYDALGQAINVLKKDQAVQLMRDGQYEVAGIFPAGAVYLYLADRNITSVNDLAGKKIATISFDDAALTMVQKVGAVAKPADIGTFASMFNNGSVDVCYAPATAYEPLELYRGLQDGGGVVNFPITQLTLQILIRHEEFPEGFGQKSRTWAADQYPGMLSVVRKGEASVAKEHWVELPEGDKAGYQALLQSVRDELVTKGQYDPTMIALGEQLTGQ